MLTVEMAILARIRPRHIVMAEPMMGRKAQKPIQVSANAVIEQ